jgi:Protein of unknown function (DUF4236)
VLIVWLANRFHNGTLSANVSAWDPLALNFSKSGIGISAGVRGLRAGITSHGRVSHVCGHTGTGLRFVRYYRHHHASEPKAHAAAFAIGFCCRS